jgi:multiple antibiotic resistance protein
VPDIVSPWGICAVIFVLTLMPAQTIPIMGILIGIMALDLLAMLFARQILRYLAFPLQLVGTVMGVLQVALSVQMVVLGIRLIAIERFGAHFPPL